MEGIGPKSNPLDDPRRQLIYKRLALISPGAEAFFDDACRLLDANPSFKTTTHLISHCLREVESSLREVIVPLAELSQGKIIHDNQYQHKQEIESIIKLFGLPKSSKTTKTWISLAGISNLSRMAHREGLRGPHDLSVEFEKFWSDVLDLFDVILDKFEARYPEILTLVDPMLIKPKPDGEDLKKLKSSIPNSPVIMSFLFDNLVSPGWLTPLRDEGFFEKPPEPEKNLENGTLSFSLWPQGRYLVRMASIPAIQSEVIKTILTVETKNIRVNADLIKSAALIPANLSVQFLPKAIKLIQSGDSGFHPEKYSDLILNYCNGGRIKEAIELARNLLTLKPGGGKRSLVFEGVADFHEWDYKQALTKITNCLVAKDQFATLNLYSDLLEEALDIRAGRKQSLKPPEDYSFIWRPAIEDHSQNSVGSLKSLLVSAVRDVAESIVESDELTLNRVIKELNVRKWILFKRVSLHLLTEFPVENLKLVSDVLTDKSNFNSPSLKHEYYRLVSKRFPDLSLDRQKIILSWIEEGPDVAAFKKYVESIGSTTVDSDTELYVDTWKRDKLAPISGFLSESWKKTYANLVSKIGEPEYPGFSAYTKIGSFGPTSPFSPEDISSMTINNMIQTLKGWKGSEDPAGNSKEGIGRALTSSVANSPEKFYLEITRFKDLELVYVQAILSGFTEAVKGLMPIDWGAILDFCIWVIQLPYDPTIKGSRNKNENTYLGWSRNTALSLISEGMLKDVIPYTLRTKVWDIIKPLTNDPDPTPEYEAGHKYDPLGLAINSMRGRAISAAIKYALWVSKHEKTNSSERTFEIIPEVKEVLEDHLNIKIDPSPAIRALYGQYLINIFYLDREWLKKSLTKIFPSGKINEPLRNAAWDAYISFTDPYDNLFDLLRDEYLKEIDLGKDNKLTVERYNVAGHLATHLMSFYFSGHMSINDKLLVKFFSESKDEDRASAIGVLGRGIADSTVKRDSEKRLFELWDHRIKVARKNPAAYKKELSSFGWWFASGKLDSTQSLEKFKETLILHPSAEADRPVIERLNNLLDVNPDYVLDCLELLIKGDKEGWTVLTWKGEIRDVLDKANALAQSGISKKVIKIAGRLVARGLIEFRPLAGS